MVKRSGKNTGPQGMISVLSVLIFISGLLFFHYAGNPERGKLSQPVPHEISASHSFATISTGIPVQLTRKAWIANDECFRLLSFAQFRISGNRRTELGLIIQEKVRQTFTGSPRQLLHNRSYSQERDEIPVEG